MGAFQASSVSFTLRTAVFPAHKILGWSRVRIDSLWLSRKSALLLLQGMPLGKLLIPNHELRHAGASPAPAGHVLLRVDSWEVWRSQPVLTNLVLANLGKIPDELDPKEVLGALASDSG